MQLLGHISGVVDLTYLGHMGSIGLHRLYPGLKGWVNKHLAAAKTLHDPTYLAPGELWRSSTLKLVQI